MPQGVFFQPGHLRLADTDLTGHLHLGLPLKIAQLQDRLFPFRQTVDGIVQGDVLQPMLVRIALIPHLIHDADWLSSSLRTHS